MPSDDGRIGGFSRNCHDGWGTLPWAGLGWAGLGRAGELCPAHRLLCLRGDLGEERGEVGVVPFDLLLQGEPLLVPGA